MADPSNCKAWRTPVGRYVGGLSGIRTDDPSASPIAAPMARHPGADWSAPGKMILVCGSQAGADNGNTARMAALPAGLSIEVPGMTVHRLCGSGLEAVATAVVVRKRRCGFPSGRRGRETVARALCDGHSRRGKPDDAQPVKPNASAIALGQPPGMSGACLGTSALHQPQETGGRRALCGM